LTAILTGEVEAPTLDEHEKVAFTNSANVLCWLLGHKHSNTFEVLLDALYKWLDAAGYQEHELPELVYPQEPN
jgi:hypothetical protein